CHYTDNARKGARPLILSRYAEVGSHRYPLGFSGDTTVTWASLDFQPYFTASAANVGFSWWSHDIGGHFRGVHNNELETRWVQLGVFSPILRLHSSPSDFTSKEPWNYGECEGIQSDFLRLRHKLIPYIYTMMHRNYSEGIPMVRPLYHKYPAIPGAFACKNEYFFGDLIAAPITAPVDADSRLAAVKVWLPAGTYIDLFCGRIYAGDRFVTCYRPLDTFPLFAKAGAILPLSADGGAGGVSNPEQIELRVFGGADGAFTMIEDNDKVGKDNVIVRTEYMFTYGESASLIIRAPRAQGIVPPVRAYTLRFAAFTAPEKVEVGGRPLGFTYDTRRRELICERFTVNEGETVTVTVTGDGKLPENEIESASFELLKRAQTAFDSSDMLQRLVCKKQPASVLIPDILSRDVHKDLKGALVELLGAK
ncbi:MAG: alpha-xylosidase, partial [Clostridia bacterium]|nr:alpha-xylosidase [Clostridia bacterium]